MLAVVRLALRRPYTFIVMAILIVIFGVLAAIRTPTDIFPDIRIPVIAAVWTYRGLSPDDMAGRVIYYYERQLSTAVNDIDQDTLFFRRPGHDLVRRLILMRTEHQLMPGNVTRLEGPAAPGNLRRELRILQQHQHVVGWLWGNDGAARTRR